MSKFSPEELEAMLDDESLSESDLTSLLAGDQETLEELHWLKSERELFEARAELKSGEVQALWQSIEARLPIRQESREVQAPWWSLLIGRIRPRFVLSGLALAGAVALTFLVVGQTEPTPTTVADTKAPTNTDAGVLMPSDKLVRANQAVVEAELAYLAALDLLEAAYIDQKPSLSQANVAQLDQDFKKAHELFKLVHEPSSENILVRRRLLSAYGSQVRSLQSTMMSFEEKSQ